MRTTLMIGTALTAIALSGCTETTIDTDAVQDYEAAVLAYNDMRTDVQALPFSTSIDMPTVGSATYEGYATILMDTPRAETALVGDAVITADFGASSVSGNLSNFVGTVDGGAYQTYGGSVALKDGEIGAVSASSLDAGMKGSLNDGEDVLSINGGIAGNFRSDGALNAAALTASDTTGTDFLLNGLEYDGELGIVAER